MVYPSPTSSARRAPWDSGERNAKKAASIWWGFRSTVAFSSDEPSFSRLSEGLRRRRRCA